MMGIYERKVINAKASAEFCEITPIFFLIYSLIIFLCFMLFLSRKSLKSRINILFFDGKISLGPIQSHLDGK